MSLTSRIQALTAYANEVTGESDTNLADAVATLAEGYVAGGLSWNDIASNTIPDGLIELTVTRLEEYCFAYRHTNHTWSVVGNDVTFIGQNAFRDCTYLTSVLLPKLTSYHSTAYLFYGCTRLVTADLGLISTFPSYSFLNCYALNAVILRKSDGVVPLANVNTFSNTPLVGRGGTYSGHVYVPSPLIESYKTAANWSTLYGNYNDIFAPIEGSIYE